MSTRIKLSNTDDVIEAAGFRGSGAELTALDAGNITTGVIDLDRLPDEVKGGSGIINPSSLTGTGTVPLAALPEVAPYPYVYNVKVYGAVGDGAADDTAAIQSAVDAANTATHAGSLPSVTIYFPPGHYKVTSTVKFNVPSATYLMHGAVLEYPNAAPATAILVIGPDDAQGADRDRWYDPGAVYGGPTVVRMGTLGWPAGMIGVRLKNLQGWVIDGLSVSNCTRGVEVLGDQAPCAYNRWAFGNVFQNKVAVQTVTIDGVTDKGWTNENAIYGGRFGLGAAPGGDASGTAFLSLTQTPGNRWAPNNWKFFGTSFESIYAATVALNATTDADGGGGGHTFSGCRWEDSGGAMAFNLDALTKNVSVLGGEQAGMAWNDLNTNNIRLTGDHGAVTLDKMKVSDVGFETSFRVDFAAGAGRYVDVLLPANTEWVGSASFSVTGTYNGADHSGLLRKDFAFYGDSSGTKITDQSQVSVALGNIPALVKIDNAAWDASTHQWYWRIWHVGATADSVSIRLSAQNRAYYDAGVIASCTTRTGQAGGGYPTAGQGLSFTLPVYANNAAAVAGGLAAGAFYRTGGDPDPVCVVH